MNYKTFATLYSEAAEYNDIDMYICERGWQDWMDSYNDPSQIATDLNKIFDMAKTSLGDIRKNFNLSRAKFCRIYHIPIRTVEDWERMDRIPDYVKCMICYTLFMQNKGALEDE